MPVMFNVIIIGVGLKIDVHVFCLEQVSAW